MQLLKIGWSTLLLTFIGLCVYLEFILVLMFIKTIESFLTGVPWW